MTDTERDTTENSPQGTRCCDNPRLSTSSDEIGDVTPTNRRRILLAGTSLALAAFAGCLGDDDDLDDDDDDDTDDPGADTDDTEDTGDEDDPDDLDDDTDDPDDDDDPDDPDELDEDTDDPDDPDDLDDEFDREVWEPMEFAFEARYEWDLFIDGEDGSLVWDVVNIEGDQITVETEYVLGDMEFEQTMTGTQQELESDLMMTPAGTAFVWTAFSPMWGGFVGEQFTVGNQWSYTTPEGSISYEVADMDTTNYPVDCYVVEMHEDDQLLHEGCISPDHGMAVYTAWYDDGNLEVEIELISFDRH